MGNGWGVGFRSGGLARRTAREMAEKRRRERVEREPRVIDLAERAMVAIGERDAAVAENEMRTGEALRELTEREGLPGRGRRVVRRDDHRAGGDAAAAARQ